MLTATAPQAVLPPDICLTTNEGITQEDYSNGWAVNSGGAAWIDGRYIQHHLNGAHISNPFVWLGICEGMKLSGHGVMANALVEAGCGAVYGYSQSVTFIADLTMYLPSFTGSLMEGATIADAFQTMKDEYGVPDPRGDAYPIIVSPVDPYPANPDSEQTVYCEWTLFGNAEPVEITGFSLAETSLEMYVGRSGSLTFNRVPDNANNYGTRLDQLRRIRCNRQRQQAQGDRERRRRGHCNHHLHRYG